MRALTDKRLRYKTDFMESTKPEGTVLSQTSAGDTVDVDTQIRLVVAAAPQPTTAPTLPPTTAAPSVTPTTDPPKDKDD